MRLRFYFCVLYGFLFLSQNALSQSPDTTSINDLLKKAQGLKTSNIAQTRIYAQKAIEKSAQLNFKPGLGKAHLIAGHAAMKLGYLDSSQINFNTALDIFEELGDNNSALSAVAYLGTLHSDYNQFDTSAYYFKKGELLARNVTDESAWIDFQAQMARSLFFQSKYEEAEKLFMKALLASKRTHFESMTAKINENMGMLKSEQGDFEESLKFFFKSLKYYEETEDQEFTARLCHNIAESYLMQNNYKKALFFQKKVLEILNELNLEVGIPHANSTMGKIYMKMAKYEKAMPYLKTALSQFQKLNSYNLIVNCHISIADCYNGQTKYDSAILWLNKVIVIDSNHEKSSSATIYMRLGKVHLNLENYRKSIYFLNKSLSIVEKNGAKPWLRENFKLLSSAFEKVNNHKESLRYHKLFKEVNDSIYNESKSKRIAEIQTKYETAKKEQAIALLEKEKELKNSQLIRAASEKKVAIGAAIISLIILSIFIIIYKQKIKAQRLLAEKTKAINKQKKLELIRQNEIKTIKASINGQEQERERIARELHHGIAGNLAAIRLNMDQAFEGKSIDYQIVSVMNNIKNTYDEVRMLSHHLIPPRLKNTSFISLIRNYIEEISQGNTFEVEFQCYPEEELNQLPNQIRVEIYRITQELISNVIKHARAEHVDLQITLHSKYVNLIVADSGIGFDSSRAVKGIGLKSITSRITLLKGDIDISSKPGKGTTINIDIPTSNIKNAIKENSTANVR